MLWERQSIGSLSIESKRVASIMKLSMDCSFLLWLLITSDSIIVNVKLNAKFGGVCKTIVDCGLSDKTKLLSLYCFIDSSSLN